MSVTLKNKNVEALVNQIKEDNLLTIEKDGEGKLAEGAVEKLLPEGVTVESIEAADNAKADLVSAIAIAFGTQSKAVFDAEASLEKAQIKTTIGRSDVTVVQQRKAEFNKPNTNGEAPEKVVREGYVSVKATFEPSVSGKKINEVVQAAWSGLSS